MGKSILDQAISDICRRHPEDRPFIDYDAILHIINIGEDAVNWQLKSLSAELERRPKRLIDFPSFILASPSTYGILILILVPYIIRQWTNVTVPSYAIPPFVAVIFVITALFAFFALPIYFRSLENKARNRNWQFDSQGDPEVEIRVLSKYLELLHKPA